MEEVETKLYRHNHIEIKSRGHVGGTEETHVLEEIYAAKFLSVASKKYSKANQNTSKYHYHVIRWC